MSSIAYDSLIAPLIDFGQQLDIEPETWSEQEELEQIYLTVAEVSASLINSLELKFLTRLINSYGDSVSCEFFVGDLSLLKVDSSIDQSKLDQLKRDIQGNSTVKLVCSLNKEKLINKLFSPQVPDGLKPILFLFEKPLEVFLSQGLIKLEQDFQLFQPKKTVILALSQEIFFEGKYLSIRGKDEALDVQHLSTNTTNFPELEQIRLKRQDSLNWQGIELKHFTPLHLAYQTLECRDLNLINILHNYLAQLIIIYIADRSLIKGSNLTSMFNTNQKSIAVKLQNLNTSSSEPITKENITSLLNLFRWIYTQNKTSYDSFSIAQITVVQTLQSLDEDKYYETFTNKAKLILDEAQWRIKAFVESKLDNFLEQELKLEDYIASSISSFEKEISNQIKSTSDTIKGAISVTIGSFIAALLKGDFNPLIFRLGLGLYLLYILIFPGFFTLTILHHRYHQLIKSYQLQIKRFKANLYSQKVDEIIDQRVFQEREKFNGFFVLIIACYALILFCGVLAMIYIPDLVTETQP